MRERVTLLVSLGLMMVCGAQRAAAQRAPVIAYGCPEHTSFEAAHYTIRRASVSDPFSYLRWLRPELEQAANAVSFLNGRPYTLAAVRQGESALDGFHFVDTSGEGNTFSVMIVTAENCMGGALDLDFRVYTTRLSPVLAVTRETRQRERAAPQESAGTARPSALGLQPLFGYDRSNGAFGGARVEIRAPAVRSGPIDSLSAEGWASGATYQASAALAGGHESDSSWLQHAAWRLDYFHSKRATGVDRLQEGTLAAQFSGTSRPLGGAGLAIRFGGMLDGGTFQSTFGMGELAANTLKSHGYGSLKVYGGATGSTRRQTFAATYGLELGTKSDLEGIDWRKHVGDVNHEAWLPVGNHRSLEVDQRFTIGGIQIPGTIPAPARFFGGNQEQQFIPGDTWKIRANPVIRSIPANRFYRTAEGAGGDRFASYNLTVAYTIWRRPLIPREILADPSFAKQVQAGLTDATSAVTVTYLAKDPHFSTSLSHLPEVQVLLDRLQTTVLAGEAANHGQFLEEFRSCKSALARAKQRAASAAKSKPPEAYGLIAALLTSASSGDENRLRKVDETCVTTLNGKIADATLEAEGSRLAATTAVMQREFNQIDQTKAADQASEEMHYAKTTLHTLLNDTNLLALSPIGIFDFAHIGPASRGLGGKRFGVGAGLRFTLVSTVEFGSGYAWTVNRRAGEDRGAFFVEMRFRDIFQ